ncbi:hypothetical protein EON65_04585 [archaeon]|nr:MAG: hypothetical protein EON65_04585 [archaeon]
MSSFIVSEYVVYVCVNAFPLVALTMTSICPSTFQNLSYGFARELDQRNAERKKAGKRVPQDTFSRLCYRQPSLTEREVLPEPYRYSIFLFLT